MCSNGEICSGEVNFLTLKDALEELCVIELFYPSNSFNNVRKSNAGVYKCLVTNTGSGESIEQSYSLSVKGPRMQIY